MLQNVKDYCKWGYRIFSWFCVAWVMFHLILIKVNGGRVSIGEPNQYVLNSELVVVGVITLIGGLFTFVQVKRYHDGN